MARKNGLNRKEQLQCAQAITDKVPMKMIAKKFKTSEAIVKKFTQEALDGAAAKSKARAEGQGKAAKQIKEKAKVLNATLDQAKKDFS